MSKYKWIIVVGSAALVGALALLKPQRTLGADDATIKLFKIQCANCHGMDGKGQTTPGKQAGVKDWSDGKTLKALSDDKIRAIIRDGVKGDDGKERMPANKKLTDEQVNALLQMVRTFQ
jgi:mono/diheme cytochrome c family protein